MSILGSKKTCSVGNGMQEIYGCDKLRKRHIPCTCICVTARWVNGWIQGENQKWICPHVITACMYKVLTGGDTPTILLAIGTHYTFLHFQRALWIRIYIMQGRAKKCFSFHFSCLKKYCIYIVWSYLRCRVKKAKILQNAKNEKLQTNFAWSKMICSGIVPQ